MRKLIALTGAAALLIAASLGLAPAQSAFADEVLLFEDGNGYMVITAGDPGDLPDVSLITDVMVPTDEGAGAVVSPEPAAVPSDDASFEPVAIPFEDVPSQPVTVPFDDGSGYLVIWG